MSTDLSADKVRRTVDVCNVGEFSFDDQSLGPRFLCPQLHKFHEFTSDDCVALPSAYLAEAASPLPWAPKAGDGGTRPRSREIRGDVPPEMRIYQ